MGSRSGQGWELKSELHKGGPLVGINSGFRAAASRTAGSGRLSVKTDGLTTIGFGSSEGLATVDLGSTGPRAAWALIKPPQGPGTGGRPSDQAGQRWLRREGPAGEVQEGVAKGAFGETAGAAREELAGMALEGPADPMERASGPSCNVIIRIALRIGFTLGPLGGMRA